MTSEFIEMWKEALLAKLTQPISKEIVLTSQDRVNEIRAIMENGEISVIISFIHLLISVMEEPVEEKAKIFQLFAHAFISSLCLSLIPITGSEKFDEVFSKYRAKMYMEIRQAIDSNVTGASEELKLVEGDDKFVYPTTTLH
jgi:hypothetical protein